MLLVVQEVWNLKINNIVIIGIGKILDLLY
nr:MAG TPA: hypothetical protein [Caudoviricetes sp.]